MRPSSGWKCQKCGFVYDLEDRPHPLEDPDAKKVWMRHVRPTEEEFAKGIYEKWQLTCRCGSQKWEPLS